MRDDAIRWQKLSELSKAKCGQDTHDIGVMREVKIEALIKRECCCIVVQCDVDLGNWRVDCMMLKTSKYFLHVSDTDSTTSGRLESVVASELYINAVFISLPLFVGEQAAELRVAVSYSFVSTQ